MRLVDIIGTTSAISPRTGQKAYDFVAEKLAHDEAITISFENISDCTSAFCNSFVGKLYMNFNPLKVDKFLHFSVIESNPIWFNKLENAKLLGSNENVRSERKLNIDNLIFS